MHAPQLTQLQLDASSRHDSPPIGYPRKQVWKVIGLTLLVYGLQLPGAQGVTFVSFDAPGAVPGSYIQPQAINPAGVITGYYTNPGNTPFGFVRALDGTITSFGQPGTQPQAINPGGTIVGYYGSQGFVRAPDGTFTTLNVPGSTSTVAYGITPRESNYRILL